MSDKELSEVKEEEKAVSEQFEEKEESRGKKIARNIVTAVVLIVIGVATAIGMILIGKSGSNGGKPAGGFGAWGGGKVQTVTPVRSVVAKKTAITDFVLTNGEVETQTALDVFPSIGGKVVQMNVHLGSAVKKGDVIAYIDPSEAGSYYVNSPVTAPISGSILTSPVKTGQKVSVSSVITRIGDIDNLQVTAKIPERFVSDLAIGQKAEISLQSYAQDKYMATVSKISPVVDPATRTKEIILTFDKKYPEVNAGMFSKVKLYTRAYDGYPVIQQDAFVTVGNDFYLYIINKDSTVSKKKVVRGKNVDGYFQVLEGITEGDAVVVEGMLTLYEGAKVRDLAGNVEFVEDKKPEGDMPEGGKPGDFPKK